MAISYYWIEKLSLRHWAGTLRTQRWRALLDRETWAERRAYWHEQLRTWRDDLRYVDWHEELKPQNWRNTLNKYQRPVTVLVVGGALLVISLSMGAAYHNACSGNYAALQTTFIDEVTGRTYLEPITALPPLPGRGGKPTIVRPVYYSPDGGKTQKLAYLEKFTDQAKAALEKHAQASTAPAGLKALVESGRLIRSPEPGSPWVPAMSAEGVQLLARVRR